MWKGFSGNGLVGLPTTEGGGGVTRAYWRGDITWNPFAGFHIAKNIRPREYLTEEELERLITHHFNKPQLSYARDVFVFAAGFWVIRTSPPRRFMPKSPCRN